MANRNDFLKYAVDMGITDTAKLNQALRMEGFDTLSKSETQMINDDTYGTNVVQRFGKGVRDLGAGMATLLGGAYNYFTDENARNQINSMIGNELSKGYGGVLLDTANLILSPYNNLTVEKALTQPAGETITDITSGAVAHPFDATLDSLGLGAGKVIGKGVKAGTKLIPDVKGLRTIKGIAEGLTDPTVKQVNQILNTSKFIPTDEINSLKTKAFNLYNNNETDLVQVYKNLETSKAKWTGTPEQIELTKQVKDFTNEVNNLMVKAGINPNKAREVAETQYVLRQLETEGTRIPFDDVRKILDNDTKVLDKYGYTKDDIVNKFEPLKAEAKSAFDSGFIFPIRHGSIGTDTSTAIQRFDNGALASRRYGNQSFEDSAKGFYPAYSRLLDDLEKSEQSIQALGEIARTVGKKVDNLNELKLADNEILVSPKKLQTDIGRALEGEGNINDIIRGTSSKLDEKDLLQYADDLYVVRKKDAEAFSKAYTNSINDLSNKLPLLNQLSSIGKSVALGTPRYVIGNEITNWSSNILEGVTPLHYVQALGEYAKYMPEPLRASTSYLGYLDKAMPPRSSLKDIYSRLVSDLKNDKTSNLEKLQAFNMMFSYPIMKAGQGYETFDRFANYIRQAEKYAKETKRTTEEVLEEAKKNRGNNPVYRELKERVDNSLGDYTGRNYYIPNNLDWLVRQTMIPFYRPYTQGPRILYHQITDNPLLTQALLRNPARIANQIEQNFIDMGGETDPRYGGFPVQLGDNFSNSRVAYSPYHFTTALAEVAGHPTEFLTQSNTFVTPFLAPLSGLNRYGDKAKLPNSYTVGGKQVIVDNNGNVVSEQKTNDILNLIRLYAANITNTYVMPVNQSNRVLLPMIAGLLNKSYKSPSDYSMFGQIGDFKIPFLMEGRQASRGRLTVEENIAPLTGISVVDVYNKKIKPLTLKEQHRLQRSINKQIKRNEG